MIVKMQFADQPAMLERALKMINQNKEIKIQSFKSLPVNIRKRVKNHILISQPEAKECFTNSAKLVAGAQGIHYVEGFALSVIPMHHAWNRYKNIYFDLTAEVGLGEGNRFANYFPLLDLKKSEVQKLLVSTEFWGEFLYKVICENA